MHPERRCPVGTVTGLVVVCFVLVSPSQGQGVMGLHIHVYCTFVLEHNVVAVSSLPNTTCAAVESSVIFAQGHCGSAATLIDIDDSRPFLLRHEGEVAGATEVDLLILGDVVEVAHEEEADTVLNEGGCLETNLEGGNVQGSNYEIGRAHV